MLSLKDTTLPWWIRKISTANKFYSHSIWLWCSSRLEDNNFMDTNKREMATNISLLKRIHKLMQVNQKELMISSELGIYNEQYQY